MNLDVMRCLEQTKRSSGILLHPISLPSRYGIGELGAEAYRFVDFLKDSKQKIWQVLPLHPVGYGESPYQSYSAFAGNPLLVSIDYLRHEGLLTSEEIQDAPVFPENRIAYREVKEYKYGLLKKAYSRFRQCTVDQGFFAFLEKNCYWLHDFALFMALKEYYDNRPWNEWDKDIAWREKKTRGYFENLLAENVQYHLFLQYKFFSQWKSLKEYAVKNGVAIMGDLPLFICYDSSDAWVNSRLFELDEKGYPAKLAGVPPDFFSHTGQLWGNPHYRWEVMAEDDYYWWRERFKLLLEMVDIVRIDHFRGFEAYWEVEGGAETAVNGRWVKGPGEKFFSVLEKYLGELPVVAEDLGYITPEVYALRDAFRYTGMKVLQFVDKEQVVKESETDNYVYYTGTHDNDTLLGWYTKTVTDTLKRRFERQEIQDICQSLIESIFRSNARMAIVPLQDHLGLDSSARMNTPGTVGDNWEWRFGRECLTAELTERLAALTVKHDRS